MFPFLFPPKCIGFLLREISLTLHNKDITERLALTSMFAGIMFTIELIIQKMNRGFAAEILMEIRHSLDGRFYSSENIFVALNLLFL